MAYLSKVGQGLFSKKQASLIAICNFYHLLKIEKFQQLQNAACHRCIDAEFHVDFKNALFFIIILKGFEIWSNQSLKNAQNSVFGKNGYFK